MTAFTVGLYIDRPIAEVDEAFLDLDNHPAFTADLDSVEVLRRPPELVGSVARLHYKDGSVMEDVLEECVRGDHYRSRVSGQGLIAHVETRLRPHGRGTDVSMRWEGSVDRWLGRLVLAFLRPVVRRRAQADLATFKRLIEAYGPHFARANKSPA